MLPMKRMTFEEALQLDPKDVSGPFTVSDPPEKPPKEPANVIVMRKAGMRFDQATQRWVKIKP